MKKDFFSKKKSLSLILLAAVISAAATIWYSAPKSSADDGTQAFNARVQDGVGSEVVFASSQKYSPQAVQSAVNSLASFISYRSGVVLSDANKSNLVNMETAALQGSARRISTEDLNAAITDAAMEKLAVLSDAQIGSMAETLRGFDAPDLPQSFKNGRSTVRYSSDKETGTTPTKFTSQLKSIRDQSAPMGDVYQASLANLVSTETSNRIQVLSAALPNTFGNVSTAGFTPEQAFLISYSVASGDSFCDSQANLNARMQNMRIGIQNVTGNTYPNPQGYKAYGVNGYIFSSPTDIIFDGQLVDSLLNKIQERTVIQ